MTRPPPPVGCSVLSPADVEHFVDRGYVRVRSAFAAELALRCRDSAALQLGIDPVDAANWDRPVVRGLARGRPFADAANAPRLLEAISQLLGPDRWLRRPDLGAVVVRFPSETDPGDTGWHVDVSFTVGADTRWLVNYRSRGRGLLMLCLLSEVGEQDAPTRLLPASHLAMPSLLYDAGEEGLPGPLAGQTSLIPLPDTSGAQDRATGSPGDVFLCHPFLVHAAGWPHRGAEPRFVCQPPIAMADGPRIDGPPERLSPVARAIRRSLDR